jgi:hypothetical protein
MPYNTGYDQYSENRTVSFDTPFTPAVDYQEKIEPRQSPQPVLHEHIHEYPQKKKKN